MNRRTFFERLCTFCVQLFISFYVGFKLPSDIPLSVHPPIFYATQAQLGCLLLGRQSPISLLSSLQRTTCFATREEQYVLAPRGSIHLSPRQASRFRLGGGGGAKR